MHFSDYTCLHTERKCGDNLKCINYLLLCDGNYDCDDGSDEHFNLGKGKLEKFSNNRSECLKMNNLTYTKSCWQIGNFEYNTHVCLKMNTLAYLKTS